MNKKIGIMFSLMGLLLSLSSFANTGINDAIRLRWWYCTSDNTPANIDNSTIDTYWTINPSDNKWVGDWNTTNAPKPTLRDLNSVPISKAYNFYLNGCKTNGIWIVGDYTLKDYASPNWVAPVVKSVPVVPPVLTPEEKYALDLEMNGSRYVLENQYLVLCDVLRQALGLDPTKEKLGFEELPIMMMQLKVDSESNYNKLRDAMQMLNMALIRYDVRWWDNCVWHAQPELTNSVNSIMGLLH